jgi:hypothetical protein
VKKLDQPLNVVSKSDRVYIKEISAFKVYLDITLTMSSTPSPPRKLGVLGCGSLGEFLIRNIQSNPSLNLTIAFAWNRTPARLDALIQEGLIPASARCDDLTTCSRFNADVIIEVCHPDVTAEWGAHLLQHSDFVF